MIYAGLSSLNILFLDGNMFRQVTISCTIDLVINFMNVFYGMECQPHLKKSLIVCMDCSMSLICSFTVHVCRCDGDKISDVFKLIVAVEISDDESPVLVLKLNLF